MSNRIDYPMDYQEGPHSYLYDINPSFSHAEEIMYASSFTKIYKNIFKDREFLKVLNPNYFDIQYINSIIDSYLNDDELDSQALSDLYILANITTIGLI